MSDSDLKHRLLAEIKDIASSLGKTPTREEFRAHSKIGERAYQKAFGGYTLLLQAAGLKKSAPKFDPKVAFQAEAPVREIPPTPRPVDNGAQNRILVLGDTHFPWVSVEGLCAVYAFIEQNPGITHVIQMGDLYDMYSWAKFPRSHLLYTPRQEIEAGREMAENMWKKIQELLPNAKCIQLMGNHDIRPMKKVLEFAPELELFVEFKKWFQFPNVHLVDDPREPFELGDICFMHGFLHKLGDHARKFLRSVCVGHTHKGGVVMVPRGSDGAVLFECNAGYLGDPTSRPMSYTATKINEWTLGFAYIDEWGPRFISL